MPARRVCIIPYLTKIVHEWFIGEDLRQNIFTDFTSINMLTVSFQNMYLQICCSSTIIFLSSSKEQSGSSAIKSYTSIRPTSRGLGKEHTHCVLALLCTKGQMKSECIYEIINFPKYHRKFLVDFCPENLFRLDMLCTHLSRVALRMIKTNHIKNLPG